MINFFRKKRKKLADDNNALKYARYAIGEIALVVVGILIALSINNWKENRKELVKESILLKQLQSEFSINLKQLDQKIAIRKELMHSTKQLFKYIDNPDQRNKDSIDFYIARTIPYTTFDPVINDLASSGSLRLIKNNFLKQMLSSWTSEITEVQEDELSWKYYRNEIYIPFLVEYYQLRTVRTKATRSNVFAKYFIKEETEISNNKSDIGIGLTKHREDFNALLNHPDYEDHLERCFTTNKFANIQSQSLRKRIVEIIELIGSEIEK
jgi:hypothetical protein